MNDSAPRPAKFPLLRFLFGSRSRRLCLTAVILVPLLGLGAIARIWRTSPPGFEPAVKISLIHWIQAQALRHSALKAEAKNQMDRALYSWRLAMAHNPADPSLSRGLLTCVLASSNKQEQAGLALQDSVWLLRLTGTNVVDLELVSKVLQAYKLDLILVGLLKPHEKALSAPMAGAYLKALFRVGAPDEFKRYYELRSSQLVPDLELSLYIAAYHAGWAKEPAAQLGWQQLDGALQHPAQTPLASQLSMAASFARRDVPRFEKALATSTNLHTDRVIDHINRWRLYVAVTNQARARELARAYSQPPANGQETLALAQNWLALDLRDKAERLLREYLPKFGDTPELWLFYADVLSTGKQWDRLSAFAGQMRQDKRVSRQLMGQSYCLEGFAEAARDHRTQAEAAFKKVPDFDLPTPQSAVAVAKSMVDLGFSDSAKRLLLKKQEYFKDEPGYWQLLYYTAIGSKDEELLLSAAREFHSLAQTNWNAKYAYAAALLTLRVQPAEAIRLTKEVLDTQPQNVGARINHCLALIQNNRSQEAQDVLHAMDRTKLDPAQSNAFNQTEFELYYSLGDLRQAREISSRINRNSLFPSEARWYENALRKIAPSKGTAARG